jgi:maleylacetoacetate isomerase
MKLYSFFRSSASYRVRIGLALKGLPYETIPISLAVNAHRGDTFRSVNPQRRVPALKLDDGSVLLQSLAILEYLEEVYPQNPMLPADPVERAKVRAVSQIVSSDIHPLNNSGTQAMLKSQFRADDAALNKWMTNWIHEGFEAVDRLLEPGPFAFGDQITMADICIVPQVYNARRFHIPLSDFPRLIAVEASARQHPAFAQAAPEAQPDRV